ncbi:MAG: hypothetical protein KGN76_04535 [Acidobacteriota bacterium]|nr:hypothetical protein [Acidobacteriota bacterium]
MDVLAEIARRVEADERLSDEDAYELMSTHDIVGLAGLADEARRRRHGRRTTFVRVLDVGLTGPLPGVVSAGELRLSGTPATLDSAIARVRQLRSVAGDVPVSGFDLSDLDALAADEGLPLRTLLERLQEAGLELVAEAPVDALAEPRAAIEAVNMAGLTLARLVLRTVPRDGLVHVLRDVASLQRAVGVLRTFQPLPRRLQPQAPTTGYADTRQVALARLLVDNIESIQVDWGLYGPKLAQFALAAGADDVDGVAAGAGPRGGDAGDEVRRQIAAAGLEPHERTGRFDAVPA